MILKITMPANMTSPLQTHSFKMKPWMKKKAEWWSYYCLGPHSHLSKEIRSYSWIWPTCSLEVREEFLYELIANLPNVVCIFRWRLSYTAVSLGIETKNCFSINFKKINVKLEKKSTLLRINFKTQYQVRKAQTSQNLLFS